MAERERFRVDGRALRIGVVRAGVGFVCTSAFLASTGYLIVPVLGDLLNRSFSLFPAVWVVAAAVAGLVGVAGVLGARRVVAEGSTGTAGARALDIARRERARIEDRSNERVVVSQRWSGDLLSGGDLLPQSEGVDQ